MNRKILFSLTILISFSVLAQTSNSFLLKEAIKQRMVTVAGQYNGGSVHYLNPVVLTIVSLVNKPLNIKIESGDLMEPEDSTCQTMIVTRDLIILLKPRESKLVYPFGMCTEPEDGAGRSGLTYTFKANSNLKLIEIARFINENKFTAGDAQNAVWCVADKRRNLLNINGYDSVSRLLLITKVAKILGKPVPDARLIREAYSSYTEPKMTETIGGSFEFKFGHTTKVHVAMFNARGTLVRELYYNPSEKPGVHKVNFEFDYTVYTDEYYDIKLIAGDEVMMSSRIDRIDDNWIEER